MVKTKETSPVSNRELANTDALIHVIDSILEDEKWAPRFLVWSESGDIGKLIGLVQEFVTECIGRNPIPTIELGIRVIELNTDRPKGEDCFKYYFPDSINIEETIDLITNTFELLENTQNLQEGDLVLYVTEEGEAKHIGKASSNGLVISKWGCRRSCY